MKTPAPRKPSVDVVIPCYNYGRYLKACVASVLSQRDVDVRVMVIDDCSSDDTPAVCREIAADHRVTCARHPENRGHIRTFNEGIIDWARADYTLLLSADDLLTPGALARAAALLDRNPDVGLVCGMAVSLSDGAAPTPVPDERDPDARILPGSHFIRHFCEVGNSFPSPVVVVRTSLQHRLGGYNPAMLHTSDMEMWMRFAAHGPVAILNSAQAYYRWHSQNMSAGYYAQAASDYNERIETCMLILREQGHRVPELAGWIAAMRRRAGGELLLLASNSFSNHRDELWRDMLASAAGYDRSLPLRLDWWKLALKRLVGQDRLHRFRGRFARTQGRSIRESRLDWTDNGKRIGWWPLMPV